MPVRLARRRGAGRTIVSTKTACNSLTCRKHVVNQNTKHWNSVIAKILLVLASPLMAAPNASPSAQKRAKRQALRQLRAAGRARTRGPGRRRARAQRRLTSGSVRRRTPRSAPRMNPFLAAIMDPCGAGLGSRVPDGQLFPTSTAQIRLRTVLGSDANGNGMMVVNPDDVLAQITGTATNGLVVTGTVNASRVITALTYFTVAQWNSFAQLNALWTQIDEARVVSSCIDLEFMGTTSADSGMVAAAVLPGDTTLSSVVANNTITSFDALAARPSAVVLPARNGVTIRHYPAVKEDLLFRDAITAAAGSVGYSGGIGPVNSVASSVGIFLTGGAASVPTLFNVMITINVEFIPAGGVAAARGLGGDQPSWIESVARFTMDAGKVITAGVAAGVAARYAGVGAGIPAAALNWYANRP